MAGALRQGGRGSSVICPWSARAVVVAPKIALEKAEDYSYGRYLYVVDEGPTTDDHVLLRTLWDGAGVSKQAKDFINSKKAPSFGRDIQVLGRREGRKFIRANHGVCWLQA